MPDPNDLICVGAIAGAFGVQGELRLKSFCSEPEDIVAYGPLWSADGKTAYKLKLTRAVAQGLAGRIKGVETRDEAEAMKGIELYAEKSRLPRLPDDEFYHADLIGLEVRDTGGKILGQVRAVHNHGAGDIIEVAGPGGALLLPFTMAVVPTVDLTAGRLIADPPEGSQ
jgi:16S rRNA processing protein RimM